MDELALVMSGGGARAAYQVGCLRTLAKHFPDITPQILTGVSAGAINAGFLASRHGALGQRLEELTELWCTLEPDKVFQVGSFSLARNVMRTGAKLVSGGLLTAPHTNALVDTSPLRKLLEERMGGPDGKLRGVAENIEKGQLRALAITTSSYSTGQSITWVDGREIDLWERAHRKSAHSELTIDHIMASSSLPIFFPAIRIGPHWYGDGGIRLTAPLSPAIHLGASRILAISTRYPKSRAEADASSIEDYPPPAQIIGVIFNAIFLDLFDADALTLTRVNKMIDCMPPKERGSFRKIDLFMLRPSRDLGKLANDYESHLPHAFRFMTRGLGTRETKSNDLLSLLMFQSDYLARLIEIGEQDAEARIDDIGRFLDAKQSTAPE
jgi:NTE family protein